MPVTKTSIQINQPDTDAESEAELQKVIQRIGVENGVLADISAQFEHVDVVGEIPIEVNEAAMYSDADDLKQVIEALKAVATSEAPGPVELTQKTTVSPPVSRSMFGFFSQNKSKQAIQPNISAPTASALSSHPESDSSKNTDVQQPAKSASSSLIEKRG